MRFYTLFNPWVVVRLYGLSSHITAVRLSHRVNKKVDFQDRFDILIEIRAQRVAEQEYTRLYGKSQVDAPVTTDPDTSMALFAPPQNIKKLGKKILIRRAIFLWIVTLKKRGQKVILRRFR